MYFEYSTKYLIELNLMNLLIKIIILQNISHYTKLHYVKYCINVICSLQCIKKYHYLKQVTKSTRRKLNACLKF